MSMHEVIFLSCYSVRRLFEAYLRALISFKSDDYDDDDKDDDKDDDGDKDKGDDSKKDDNDDDDRASDLRALLAKLFSSNIKDSEEKKEFFDSEEDFTKKVDQAAEWMKECKHIIMFTGAGISTR